MKTMATFYAICLIMSGLAAQKTVKINGELSNCGGNQLYFYQHDGITLKPIQSISLALADERKGTFAFQTPALEKGFYYIGANDRNFKLLLLGSEVEIALKGDFNNLAAAQVIKSAENTDYANMMNQSTALINQFQQTIGQYRAAANDPAKAVALDAQLKTIDGQRKALLEAYRKTNPFLADLLAINTYYSYQNHKAPNQGEPDYFARQYLANADFSKPTYNHIPHLQDAFKAYASTLNSVGFNNDQQRAYIEQVLAKFPAASPARLTALSGLLVGYMDKNPENFVHYSKLFLAQYNNANPDVATFILQKVQAIEVFAIGKTPPDIAQTTPDGSTKKLSDLRGKVVLLDFWASWCGPCRKENPHVVALYQKYKDRGFDVFGVSLDRTKEPWLQAIDKDGLQWHHVSDLKGWKNEAAVLYGVTSIPQTFLLDAEGRIIAKNLRGEQLTKKLEELLGK